MSCRAVTPTPNPVAPFPKGRLLAGLALVVLVLAAAAPTARSQGAPGWKPFAFFVGEWTGEENATFGKGRGTRTYEMILQDTYLMYRNRSSFEPQESLPEGDVHEDLTILSYDEGRSAFVLRQFNSEGFVNRFVLEEGAPENAEAELAHLVFVAEDSENSPSGLRVRLQWTPTGPDTFSETFELAMPEKDFKPLIRNEWTRTK